MNCPKCKQDGSYEILYWFNVNRMEKDFILTDIIANKKFDDLHTVICNSCGFRLLQPYFEKDGPVRKWATVELEKPRKNEVDLLNLVKTMSQEEIKKLKESLGTWNE